MSKKYFTENKHLFFDGGFGSYMIEKGINYKLIALANFFNRETVVNIHKEYVMAGADFITTNTFSANRYKLKDTDYSVEDVIATAIELAKISIRNTEKNIYIAQSISPIGKLLVPNGDLEFDDAYDMFKEQVIAGDRAGSDIYLLETFSDIGELRCAIFACKENSNKPIFVTMTFEENGKTLMGTDTKTFVNIVQNLGVDIIGVNCSSTPKKLKSIVNELIKYSNIPILIQPNRDLPKQNNRKIEYNVSKEEFLNEMVDICKEGIHILGGCCGTTPEFIKILVDNANKFNFKMPTKKSYSLVSSATKTVDLKSDVILVGERINPTGRKNLQEDLKGGKYDTVIKMAIDQCENGADILDVNAVCGNVDEVEALYNIMNSITAVIDIPLQFDSMNSKAIEKVLRYYNGRAIVNSINGKEKVLEDYLPIIKKYGALAIGLTLGEKGLPSDNIEKIDIAESILNKWLDIGLNREDLILDALTLTVSAQQKDVFSSIICLNDIKEKFGVLTLLGVSNVSFGVPNRSLLNRTYLTLAIANGLNLAIIDPLDRSMVDTVYASKAILNRDENCKEYIKRFSNNTENLSRKKQNVQEYTLSEIIFKGLKSLCREKTEELILSNASIDDIINNELINTLNIIGNQFSKDEIFLPDLIRSSECVKESFEVIKKHIVLNNNKMAYKGKIILATVEGDVHDIGKNIVKTVLESYGYDIIDLGKDVGAVKIVDAIRKYQVKLVGLSALMTTTVESMREVIELVKYENLDCKIMVGGAVLSEAVAKDINADYYGKDARESVEIANKVFNLKI